jgi:hypothetical protein
MRKCVLPIVEVFRDEVGNKVPIFMIIFSLIKTNSLSNNELFKRKSTKSKGNRIIKMGTLFLNSCLDETTKVP